MTKKEAEIALSKARLVMQQGVQYKMYSTFQRSKSRGGYGIEISYVSADIKRLIVPKFVTRIGYGAGELAVGLEELIINTDEIDIADKAFYRSGLKKVHINAKECTIGNSAFALNMLLDEVEISGNTIGINESAFRYCNIKCARLSNGLKYMDSFVFANNDGMERLMLPDSLCNRDAVLFPDDLAGLCENNGKLSEVKLSKGITAIGMAMFSGCNSLDDIELHEGLKRIDKFAFEDCSIRRIVIPSTVEYMKMSAFHDSMLEELVILSKDIDYSSIGEVIYGSTQYLKLIKAPKIILDNIMIRGTDFKNRVKFEVLE